MPYLIDGHNLIPKIPGIELSAIDDEMQLVELLQDYCRVTRRQVEVFFDNAPPGAQPVRKFGQVTARFIRQGTTADRAIQQRLQRLGRAARNWTVVSSDRQVQNMARDVSAQVVSSEDFSHQLLESLSNRAPSAQEKPASEEPLSAQELEDWLRLFGGDEE